MSTALQQTGTTNLMELAKQFSESAFCPKDYRGKPGDTFIAMQMGQDLGINPLQAPQNISVINGRPSIWGDTMWGLITGRRDLEDSNEWDEGSIEKGDAKAFCLLKRAGRTAQTRSFSIEDAKRAKLWGKQGPWTDYPLRMLQMRARGFCCRDVYPDVLKGIITTEEAMDIKWIEAQVLSNSRVDSMKKTLGADPKPAAITDESGAPSASAPATKEDISKKITEATTLDELNATIAEANQLTGEDKDEIRILFRAKKTELTGS